MKKRNQSSSLNGAPNPISASGGLWFAPTTAPATAAAAPVEPKTVAPPQPQHAWEMTLEQFQQQFFPQLYASRPATETEPSPQRDAA